MGEYLHVKDFLSPFKFSSWYLLQCFGYAEICETPQETEGLQEPALCYLDANSNIFASQQRNITEVTFLLPDLTHLGSLKKISDIKELAEK